MNLKTQVLIVGGGATGVGVSRDLSLRGIPSLLIERGDFASGASGRNHGLLHSGGRYAVSDSEAAKECIVENKILKKIAPRCVEETDGLFITLPEDPSDFKDCFLSACEKAGIETASLSANEALSLEPELNPDLLGAIKVPDGSIDPFALVQANAKDAEARGAKFLLHTEVTSIISDGGKVKGVKAVDLISGEEYVIDASYIVNATGAWANRILNLAGLHIGIALSKGSLMITNRRLTRMVINRCRPAANGDILVPNEIVSILGTTSVRSEDVSDFVVSPEEVSLLIREGSKMIPSIENTRFIRAYAGIRPLFQSAAKRDDRTISRGFALIDHGEKDGIKNLITITGGKLMTYRLMAERTADLICKKMGISASCSTHLTPLPGSGRELETRDRLKKFGGLVSGGAKEILCDCEMIGREEVEATLSQWPMKDLHDVLHRSRIAKGTCQGGFCVYRLLGVLHEAEKAGENSGKLLEGFLEERWKGIRPVLWGATVKEEELIESVYKGIFNSRP
jgi:glycerol-3-phosphate dehydrogenase